MTNLRASGENFAEASFGAIVGWISFSGAQSIHCRRAASSLVTAYLAFSASDAKSPWGASEKPRALSDMG